MNTLLPAESLLPEGPICPPALFHIACCSIAAHRVWTSPQSRLMASPDRKRRAAQLELPSPAAPTKRPAPSCRWYHDEPHAQSSAGLAHQGKQQRTQQGGTQHLVVDLSTSSDEGEDAGPVQQQHAAGAPRAALRAGLQILKTIQISDSDSDGEQEEAGPMPQAVAVYDGMRVNSELYSRYMKRSNKKGIKVWEKLVKELRESDAFKQLPLGTLTLACNLGPGYRSTSAENCAGCSTASHTKWHPMLVSLSARRDDGQTFRDWMTGSLTQAPASDRLCCEYVCGPACVVRAPHQPTANMRNVLPPLALVPLQLPGPGHRLMVAPSVLAGLERAIRTGQDLKGWSTFKKELGKSAWQDVAQLLPRKLTQLLDALPRP